MSASSSTIFPSLRADSPEALALTELIKPSSFASFSKNPFIKWVDVSFTEATLFINNNDICIFNYSHEVRNTLYKISKWITSLPLAYYLQPQITFTCCKNGLIILETDTLSIPQIIQLVASLVELLKIQLFYSSQNPDISFSQQKVAFAHINTFVTPLLHQLHTTYSYFSYLITDKEPSSSLHSLITLSTLALLKNPIPQLNEAVTHCNCNEIHTCLNECIEKEPTLKKLSTLIKKIFASKEVFLVMHQYLNIAVNPIPKKGKHTLILQHSSEIHHNLKLFPFSMSPHDMRSLRRIVQQQLTIHILSTFLSEPQHQHLSPSILMDKLLGLCLNHQYQKLLMIEKKLSKSLSLFFNCNHAYLANALNFSLTQILSLFPTQKCNPSCPLTLNSIKDTINTLICSITSLSHKVSKYLKHSHSGMKPHLIDLNKKTRHVRRLIALLQKTAQLNTDPWISDFLEEVKNTLSIVHKILLAHIERTHIKLDPKYTFTSSESLTYTDSLSFEYLQIDALAPRIKSSLRSKTSKLNVSFSEELTKVQLFDSKEPIN